MDAYDIKNKIFELWQRLSDPPSAAEIKKQFGSVPVYVEVDNNIYQVTGVKDKDSKIILEIDSKENGDLI